MGFMDKIKEASQNVAAEAKKATATGKEKLEDMQAKKKMDEAAKKIGWRGPTYAKLSNARRSNV